MSPRKSTALQPRHEPGFPRGLVGSWEVARVVVPPIVPRMWDFRLTGEPNPVPEGPLVVAANHFSFVDPFIVGLAIRRPIRFMGVDELFGNSAVFDAFLYWCGTVPMPRERPPLRALKTALAHLEQGGGVALFPEGRRVEEWGQSPPKEGAAWLALRTGAPLVPVAIVGTDDVMGINHRRIQRAPVRVAVGDPLWPADFRDRAEMTNAWLEWMEKAMIRLAEQEALV